MLERFIARPVLSTVVSIIIFLLGLLSLFTLPITLFPDIAPPTIQVTAIYPGANAEVVARSVATPLEEAVNGVEGMTYMTSTSSNDGSMTLNVYFRVGVNPDLAAVNVQSRVSRAVSQLPQEVVQAGISTQKQQNSILMVPLIYSTDSLYDETFLQNYAKINILPDLQRVPGVGQAMVFGAKDYSMRIWLKPDRLTANELSVQEVMNAVREQNLEAAPGRFGQGSDASFEYILKYKGKLSRNEDYENIIIRSAPDGSLLRLKDVARIEFGSFAYSANTNIEGRPGTGIALFQTAGSNANDILTEAEEVMERAAASFPKGIEYFNMYSAKEFLDESIAQVEETLFIAFGLVFLVVFVFLQDLRSTLIPAIAVPVAIVGTFFFMQLFGFTINLLTLFALVLAIGVVVDDAIVVVEAVHTKMERTQLPARPATIQTMREITGAIVSITLVMAAVFVPVGFMQGPSGVFYKQFAFTLAVAILISAVNALTLSPALCALFLKKHRHDDTEDRVAAYGFGTRFFGAFNAGFGAITGKYRQSIRFLLRRKWAPIAGLILVSLLTIWLAERTPKGFIPTEDQGFILFSATLPPGASLDRTQKVVDKIDSLLYEVEAVERRGSVTGLNFIANAISSNYAIGFIRMKPHGERGPVNDINEVMGVINENLSGITEASVFLFEFPTVQGFGNISGFECLLQDRSGGPLDKLEATAQGFIERLTQRPEIDFAFTTFSMGNPQYMLDVNEARAKQFGVSISDLLQTLQVYYGSAFVSDFNRFGKYYRVIAQADAPYRMEPSSLNDIFVKNNLGEMVPANALVSLERVYGPETVTRNNLFNAASINGIAGPGYSSGDAIQAVREVAESYLPRGYSYEWSGMSREEIGAGSQSNLIFLLSVLFVFFLLAAQYESYILPLAVILTVPVGVFGVFLFINLTGIDNNIYVQVGLIMLIGLLAKNAILIVEYAVQRRRAGMSLTESALEASQLRFRPILMTSFAFIVGLLPLTWADGGSALGNRSIGTGALGGMLVGVILGVFIIPVLFVIFQFLQEKITGGPKPSHLAVFLPFLLLLSFSSCKVGEEYRPPQVELPSQFSPVTYFDTSGIADIEWKNFFADPVLQSLIERGLTYNHDLLIAVNRIDMARQYVERASAWPARLDLQVAGRTDYPSRNSLAGISTNSFLGQSHLENYIAGLYFSWEIDAWGKIRSQEEAARAEYLQTYEAAKAVQTQLVADIAQEYFDLLMLDKQLEIAGENLALADTFVLATRLLKDAGAGNALAVQQAEAQKQSTALLIPQLEQNRALRENALQILTGSLPGPIARRTVLDDRAITDTLSTGLPAAMVSRRPDVRSAEMTLVAANASLGIAQANLYPVLNITAGMGLESFKFDNWLSIPGSLLGLATGAVAQPLLNRKELKTQFELAKLEREQAAIRFRQSVLHAVGEVSNALVQAEKLKRQQEIAQEQVDTLHRAVFNARLLFRSDMANYLEVISAQGNALQAELELAAIQRRRLGAKVELYRALGGGWR